VTKKFDQDVEIGEKIGSFSIDYESRLQRDILTPVPARGADLPVPKYPHLDYSLAIAHDDRFSESYPEAYAFLFMYNTIERVPFLIFNDKQRWGSLRVHVLGELALGARKK
jgi:hypothetical protein